MIMLLVLHQVVRGSWARAD